MKNKAFSLIELLVSLIIISLLVGAFSPVITKKLKFSEITVGSFGTTVTSDDCDQFSSQNNKCIMCTTSSCSLCTSQMNLEAGYYVDPAVSCDPKECTDFGENCVSCTKEGCSSCSAVTSVGYYTDPAENCEQKKCSDKFGNDCSDCTKDKCTSCAAGTAFNSNTNTCEKCDAGYYSPGGMSECKKCETGKISSSGASSCTECSVASHKVANADGTACEDKNCPSGQYIDGVTCKPCPSGTYKSGDNQNSCAPCASICGTCNSTTGKCNSCNSPYTMSSSGTCTLGCNPQTVTLSGTTTKVTRFNMGDDPNCPRDVLASLTGVTFVEVGTSCTGDLCCWYGKTANTCNDNSGGIYSGCNRTVCKWWAAEKLCGAIGTGWKLPDTNTSMASWYPANSTASTGLMLCDESPGSTTTVSRCSSLTNCPNASSSKCNTYYVWASSNSGTTAQSRNLRGGGWSAKNSSMSYASSVRCVKE